jgi:hypothetical protein
MVEEQQRMVLEEIEEGKGNRATALRTEKLKARKTKKCMNMNMVKQMQFLTSKMEEMVVEEEALRFLL